MSSMFTQTYIRNRALFKHMPLSFQLISEPLRHLSTVSQMNDIISEIHENAFGRQIQENPAAKRIISPQRFCVLTKTRAPKLLLSTIGIAGTIEGIGEKIPLVHGAPGSNSMNTLYLSRLYVIIHFKTTEISLLIMIIIIHIIILTSHFSLLDYTPRYVTPGAELKHRFASIPKSRIGLDCDILPTHPDRVSDGIILGTISCRGNFEYKQIGTIFY